MITVGADAASSRAAIDIAAAHDDVWATVGLHPHEAKHGVDTIVGLLDEPRVVAVGECGLDYHYDHSPRPAQRAAFAAQIRLAHERRAAARHPHARGVGRHVRHPRRRRGAGDAPSSIASPADRRRHVAASTSGTAVVLRHRHVQVGRRGAGRGRESARTTGCSSRRTRPTSRRCPTGGAATNRRSWRWSDPRWPPLRGVTVEDLSTLTPDERTGCVRATDLVASPPATDGTTTLRGELGPGVGPLRHIRSAPAPRRRSHVDRRVAVPPRGRWVARVERASVAAIGPVDVAGAIDAGADGAASGRALIESVDVDGDRRPASSSVPHRRRSRRSSWFRCRSGQRRRGRSSPTPATEAG